MMERERKKSELIYLLSLLVGVVMICSLGSPYLTDYDYWFFEIMSEEPIMVVLCQILSLLTATILLFYGIISLIIAFKNSTRPRKYPDTRIGEYGILIYCGVNILLLISLVIFCLDNYRHSLGFGMISTLVFSVLAAIICLLVRRKYQRRCNNCSSRVHEKDIFCSKCGKKIGETESDKTIEAEQQEIK